jgi:hypothetical protein
VSWALSAATVKASINNLADHLDRIGSFGRTVRFGHLHLDDEAMTIFAHRVTHVTERRRLIDHSLYAVWPTE